MNHRVGFALLFGFSAFGPAWTFGQAAAAGGSYVEELKFGILDHDVPDMVSGHRREHGQDVNAEAVFSPSVAFLGGDIRPAAGVSFNDDGDTSQIYAYGRWERTFHSGFFIATGLGATLNNGETTGSLQRKALGSHILFHIPLELGWRFTQRTSLSAYFDHMSNGYLANANEGLDTLGMRWGIRL